MSNLCREDFDAGPKHVFSIEDGLWLGKYTILKIVNDEIIIAYLIIIWILYPLVPT